MQVLTPNSVNIRWATDISTNSRVYYGTDLSYGSVVDSATITTEHEIKLVGAFTQHKILLHRRQFNKIYKVMTKIILLHL